MQMRPEIQIQSAIKALTDVVLPAIEPEHKLAQEQVRLVIGLLGVMAKQLPLQFRFDCDELARLLKFADELKSQAPALVTPAAALAEVATQAQAGSDVLARAKADPAELIAAVRGLRSATGSLISAAYQSADDDAIAKLEKTVLAMSSEQLLRERSWFLPQGWEPATPDLPAIETLIGVATP